MEEVQPRLGLQTGGVLTGKAQRALGVGLAFGRANTVQASTLAIEVRGARITRGAGIGARQGTIDLPAHEPRFAFGVQCARCTEYADRLAAIWGCIGHALERRKAVPVVPARISLVAQEPAGLSPGVGIAGVARAAVVRELAGHTVGPRWLATSRRRVIVAHETIFAILVLGTVFPCGSWTPTEWIGVG